MSGPQPECEVASPLELSPPQFVVMAVAVGLVGLLVIVSPRRSSPPRSSPQLRSPALASARDLVGFQSMVGADSLGRSTDDQLVSPAGPVGQTGPVSPAGPVGPVGPVHFIGSSAPLQIDLNTASLSELGLLPGIGDKTAARLIAARTRLGGFRSWQDVEDISGMGPATVAAMEPWCKSLTVFPGGSMVSPPHGMPVTVPSTNPLVRN